jgi:hypothetical protein
MAYLQRQVLGYAMSGLNKIGAFFKGNAEKVGGAIADKAPNVIMDQAAQIQTLSAAGKLSNEALKDILGNGANKLAQAGSSAASGSNIVKPVLIGAGLAAGEFVVNGKNGLVGGAINSGWTEVGKIEAEQNTVGKFHGFYKFIQELLNLFGIKNTFLNDWANKGVSGTTRKDDSLYAVTRDTIKENLLPASLAVASVMAAPKIIGHIKGKSTPVSPADVAPPGLSANSSKGMLGKLFTTKAGLIGLGIAGSATALGINYARSEEAPAEPIRTNPVTGIPLIAQREGVPAISKGYMEQAAEFVEQGKDYGKGLIADADTKNWSVGNTLNLANAGVNGLAKGVGLVGSFAYANTIGWFTDQTTNEVQDKFVGRAIDVAFEKTVGAPDLSGHWAHAVNFGGQMGMPAKAGLSVGLKLANTLGFGQRALPLAATLAAPAPQF